MSRLALFYLAQNKPLTYMLLNISNITFNWLTQCSSGILYIRNVWNEYLYLLKTCDRLQLPKPRPGKTRQHKTRRPPNKKVSPGFTKYNYVQLWHACHIDCLIEAWRIQGVCPKPEKHEIPSDHYVLMLLSLPTKCARMGHSVLLDGTIMLLVVT